MSPVVRRYKVTAGKHHAGNNVVYRMNDVLESTRQLDKLYINKFVEVSDVTPVTAQPDPSGVPPVRAAVPAVTIDPRVIADLKQAVNEQQSLINEQAATIADLQKKLAEKKPAAAKKTTPPPTGDAFDA